MILSSWEDIQDLENKKYKISYINGFPKIIHQSWKTIDVPEHWKISKENWIKYHPEYIYILWTDEMNLKLISNFYSDYLEQFKKYPHNIQRADFSRICYLHRYGGLYSDLDISPNRNCDTLFRYYSKEFIHGDAFDNKIHKLEDSIKSFDLRIKKDDDSLCDLSNDSSLEEDKFKKEVGLIADAGHFNCYIDGLKAVSSTNIIGVIAKNLSRYTNMFMISKKGSRFWEDVLIESRNQNPPKHYSSRHFRIMWTTGPLLIDRVANRRENKKIVYNLPPKYVNPCTVCDVKPCTTDEAYITMLAGSSWMESDGSIITWCSCHLSLIICIIILIIIIIIAYFLSKNYNKKK